MPFKARPGSWPGRRPPGWRGHDASIANLLAEAGALTPLPIRTPIVIRLAGLALFRNGRPQL